MCSDFFYFSPFKFLLIIINCFWVCSFICYCWNHNYYFIQDIMQWGSLRERTRKASMSVIVVTKLIWIMLLQNLLTFYAWCQPQIRSKSHHWLLRIRQGTAIAWIKIQTPVQGLKGQWWNAHYLPLQPLGLPLPAYQTQEIMTFLLCFLFLCLSKFPFQ